MNSFIIFSTILAITSGHRTYHVPHRSVDYAKGAEAYQSGLEQQSQHHGFHQSQGWQQQGEDYQGQKNEGDAHAKILSFKHEHNGHGYQYSYETDNGIKATEHGTLEGKTLSVKGEYSYKGDDGQVYTVTYTADENGFRPEGSHIPTPPPIPEAILNSLEQNKHEEASGSHDDGSYKEYKEVETQEEALPQYQSTYEHYQPQYQAQQPEYQPQQHEYQPQQHEYQPQQHEYQLQQQHYQPQQHYDFSHYQHQQPSYQSQGIEHGYQHADTTSEYGGATVEVSSSSSNGGGYHYRH